jgi:hypothetical protein
VFEVGKILSPSNINIDQRRGKPMSGKEDFEKLMEHFLKMPGVQKQGNSLKKNRKMFVMWGKDNQFVVKLAAPRVKELVDSGQGLPWDPGTGKFMKEWVAIPPNSLEVWINLAEEAKTFVTSLKKKK